MRTSHRLTSLNTWSPIGDTIWGCLEANALLVEVCHWGRGFEISKPCVFPNLLHVLLAVQNVSHQLLLRLLCLSAAMIPQHDGDGLLRLWCQTNPSFCKLGFGRGVYHSHRKAVQTEVCASECCSGSDHVVFETKLSSNSNALTAMLFPAVCQLIEQPLQPRLCTPCFL